MINLRYAALGPVPVLYGSDRLAGAISETVFHDVPADSVEDVDAVLRRVGIEVDPGWGS